MNIMDEIYGVLASVGYVTSTVTVFIKGDAYSLRENEIRALQVLAKREAEKSDEAFKKFCDDVRICSGDPDDPYMIFRKDGTFENDFCPGFMDVGEKLVMAII